MPHWSDSYINIPHTRLDCAELVEVVLREQFGRAITFPRRQDDDIDHRSSIIVAHQDDYADCIEQPVDGCGVLMLFRGRRAHIGLYALIRGLPHVLHSDAVFGASVRMPLQRVAQVYRIEGFYAWRD